MAALALLTTYVALCLLPFIADLIAAGVRALARPLVRRVRLVRARRRAQRHVVPGPCPTCGGPLPIERISADLRRLATEIEYLHGAPVPARYSRLLAASIAYDDVLLAACRALDVPVAAQRGPLPPVERLEAEAHLAGAGLRW